MKIGYDYLTDLRERKYSKVAELVRSGDISMLSQEGLDLLALRIEGKNKRGNTGDPFLHDLATSLSQEYSNLRKYGLTSKELMQLSIEIMIKDGKKSAKYDELNLKGMSRNKALEKIKEDLIPKERVMDLKRISDLITLGNKIIEAQYAHDLHY